MATKKTAAKGTVTKRADDIYWAYSGGVLNPEEDPSFLSVEQALQDAVDGVKDGEAVNVYLVTRLGTYRLKSSFEEVK